MRRNRNASRSRNRSRTRSRSRSGSRSRVEVGVAIGIRQGVGVGVGVGVGIGAGSRSRRRSRGSEYDPCSGNDGSRSPALYEGVGPAIARPGGQGLDGQLRLFVAPASMPQQLRIADRATLPGDPFFFSGVGGCGRRPSRIRRPREACGAVERKSP